MPSKIFEAIKSRPTPPAIQRTIPQVFIIESLRFEDEDAKRFEGRIIADTLTLCGKKPIYYYFRTPDELQELAIRFRDSGYRYLHLSCHGTAAAVHTTLGQVSPDRFASIFSGHLRNRRLFISACSIGLGRLPQEVRQTNRGMYSIVCPMEDIRFGRAAAIWNAFYVRMLDDAHLPTQEEPLTGTGNTNLKNKALKKTLKALCQLFDVRMKWSYHDTVNDRWRDEDIASADRSPRTMG